MNTAKTITVFVKRDKSAYIASVGLEEYTSYVSSTVAAQIAAGRYYGVPRELIDLLPTGPHTMIASVKRPCSPIAWGLLLAGSAAATLVALCWALWQGGAL